MVRSPGARHILAPWQPTSETSKSGRKPSPSPPTSSASSAKAPAARPRSSTDQLMLSALSAASTIADGYGRYTAPEQTATATARAKRELLRLETQLAIARQADLISAHTHADLVDSHPERRIDCSAATSSISSGSSPSANANQATASLRTRVRLRSELTHDSARALATNRSTRSTVAQPRQRRRLACRRRACAVLDRCDDDAKPRMFATSRRS